MTLQESEALLFEEWKKQRSPFYPDGVVDEESWTRSIPKILLLLKEVNDPDGAGWDLRTFLRDRDRSYTWYSVVRWIRAIRKLPQDMRWRDVEDVKPEHRRDSLGSIAVMNLKKSPGSHVVHVKRFRKVVEEDQKFLRRQFALYNADLVLCCGSEVTAAFRRWIKPEMDSSWRQTRQGISFLEYQRGQHVIDYAHPAARVSPYLLHYPLIEAIREIRKVGGESTA